MATVKENLSDLPKRLRCPRGIVVGQRKEIRYVLRAKSERQGGDGGADLLPTTCTAILHQHLPVGQKND